MSDEKLCYDSDEEIRALVEGFESCSLPPDDFDHRAHLAVAAWYLCSMTDRQATSRMRSNLLSYIAHHEVDPKKYNETITQFWVKRLRAALNETDASRTSAERVNEAIERAGSSQLVFEYYSRERVFSEEARSGWVEPDIKPLER